MGAHIEQIPLLPMMVWSWELWSTEGPTA
jgi:hypothetical protein